MVQFIELCQRFVRWLDRWLTCLAIQLSYLCLYYLYVHELCLLTVESVWTSLLYLLGFHFIYINMMCFFFRVISAKHPLPPNSFRLPLSLQTRFDSLNDMKRKTDLLGAYLDSRPTLPIEQRLSNGRVRYCFKCSLLKPDRSHHCSTCDRCVLFLDHHCWILNACIHFNNYKFFLLFVACAFLLDAYCLATVIPFLLDDTDINNTHPLLYAMTSLVATQSVLLLFKAAVFARNLFENATTIESAQKLTFAPGVARTDYNLGCAANWRQVFGPWPALWFLPFRSSFPVDGYTYKLGAI